jgi:hypothetical protein
MMEITPSRTKYSAKKAPAREYFRLIFQLLNNTTLEMCHDSWLDSFWRNPNHNLSNLLEKISILAPNMLSLEVKCIHRTWLPSPFIRVKEPMVKLRALRIFDWVWSDNDLDLMTRMVPNLEELEDVSYLAIAF